MRRERVAQHVRMHVTAQPALDRPGRETLLDRRAARVASTGAAHEKRLRIANRQRNAPREPRFAAQRRAGAPTGTMRSFDPLPQTRTSPRDDRAIERFDARKLGDAQPRGIRQLEQAPDRASASASSSSIATSCTASVGRQRRWAAAPAPSAP